MRAKQLLLVALPVLLCACGDSITDYVNKKFPPVSIDDQRAAAIASALESLALLDAPNLAFGIPLEEAQAVLLSEKLKDQGASAVKLTADRQLVTAEIDFARTFTGDPAVANVGDDLLETLSPHVAGTVTVHAGITSAVASAEEGDAVLTLKVLPVFETVKITEVTVKEDYDVTALGDVLAGVLNRYADNVSGVLADLPVMDIEVPARFTDTLDPNKSIQIADSGVEADVTLSGNVVSAPIRLHGVAWMVSSNRLAGLAQFVPAEGAYNPEGSAEIDATSEAIEELFKTAVMERFGIDAYPDKVWAAIRKDLVSYIANQV